MDAESTGPAQDARAAGLPRLPPWYVPRTPLTEGLIRSADPLVVVRGAAGTGKSAFAAELAHRVVSAGDRAVVWLDVGQVRDRASMWRSVAARLHVTGALRASAADGHPETLVAAAAALHREVLLVLDRYDERCDDATDDDVVAALCATHLLSVVVTTRSTTALERGDALLRLGARVLPSSTLALDRDEVERLAALADVVIPPERTAAVVEATGGSPLFVRAVVLAARTGALDVVAASTRTLTETAARAGTGLLDGTDDALRAALHRLAVPASATDDLAARLAPEGPAALRHAERVGLGTWIDDAPPLFVFTPVVRSALRSDLRTHDPDAEKEALRVTGEWAVDTGDYFVGLEAAVERGDYVAANRHALLRHVELTRADPDRTQRILRRIPMGVLARSPLLALFVALGDFAQAKHRVRAAEMLAITVAGAVARYPRASRGERAVIVGVESIACRLLGRGERSAALARRTLAMLDEIPRGAEPDLDAARPVALRQLALSLLAVGDVVTALYATEASSVGLPEDEGPAIQGRMRTSGLLAIAGEVRRAASLVDDLPADERLTATFGPYQSSMATLARATSALEDGRLDEARRTLDALEPEMRTNEFWPFHSLAQVTLDLAAGTPDDALERLEEALAPGARAPASAFWRERLAAARADVALAGARADEAFAALRRLGTGDPVVRAARARLHHALGQDEQALRLLGAYPDTQHHGVRTEIEHLVVRGLCTLGTGDTDAAVGDLRRAVSLTRRSGCRSPWLLTSRADRDAVSLFLDHDVADVLAGLPVVLTAGLRTTTLSDRELVVLEHLADGLDVPRIASTLHVSPNTVKTQLRSTYRKLGVRRRDDAVVTARRLGILP